MKIKLRKVSDFTIIRLDDGRLGIVAAVGMGILANHNVIVGRGQRIKLDGMTEVEIVKYPMDILMEALEKEKAKEVESIDLSTRFVPPCTCRPIRVSTDCLMVAGEADCPIHGYGVE